MKRLPEILVIIIWLLLPSVLHAEGYVRLRSDVEFLSDSLCCGRATGTGGGFEAARFIFRRFEELEMEPVFQHFQIDEKVGHNIIAQRRGKGNSYILVCAFYDGMGTLGGKLRPGADSNASGVAAMLALADSLRDRNVIFAALDAHNHGNAGAAALYKFLSRKPVRAVVSLEVLGSSMAPVRKYLPRYMMILGGKPWKNVFEKNTRGLDLSYDYYGNADFTNLFYRKISDLGPWINAGVPSVLFTSGITYNTNQITDTFDTLDYGMLSDRISVIYAWIKAQLPRCK